MLPNCAGFSRRTAMSKPDACDQQRVWERGWDEHERLQLLRMAKLSLAQKLEWLEQAHWLARQFEANRQSRNSSNAPAPSDSPKQK
jgi:hypothetical protein